jgi:hypothetical protein
MMPFNEQKELLKIIDQFCLEQNLPAGKIEFRDIPFSGEWGIAAPLFPLAAADPNRSGPVPQHAQTLSKPLLRNQSICQKGD